MTESEPIRLKRLYSAENIKYEKNRAEKEKKKRRKKEKRKKVKRRKNIKCEILLVKASRNKCALMKICVLNSSATFSCLLCVLFGCCFCFYLFFFRVQTQISNAKMMCRALKRPNLNIISLMPGHNVKLKKEEENIHFAIYTFVEFGAIISLLSETEHARTSPLCVHCARSVGVCSHTCPLTPGAE